MCIAEINCGIFVPKSCKSHQRIATEVVGIQGEPIASCRVNLCYLMA